MTENGDRRKEQKKDDDIDPDAAPEPETFQRPKGLLGPNAPDATQDDLEVKSGAATATPTRVEATPSGADVRVDKREPAPGREDIKPPDGPVEVRFQVPDKKPKPHVPTPDEFGPINVQPAKPDQGPKPYVPKPDDFGPIDVQRQKGAPKLPKLEAPGEFSVVRPQPEHQSTPHVASHILAEGDVEVVDYRRTGPVDVSSQAHALFEEYQLIGVVDTTFARTNMGAVAEDELKRLGGEQRVVRRTVPGVKDLAVECKRLIDKHGCDIVIACGMVGKMPVDKTCAHEASLAIQWAQLETNTHILEVFVHEDEAKDENELAWLMRQRTKEHAENAWNMLFAPERLTQQAGTGQRQGFKDEGPIRAK